MYRGFVPSSNQLQPNRGCPVCGNSAYIDDDGISGTLVRCRVCGKFRFDFTAHLFFDGAVSSRETSDFYKLSYQLRTISERAWGKRDNSFFPMYSGEELARMLKNPDLPLEEKMAVLLRYLGSKTEYPGETVRFASSSDYSVLNAMNPVEANYYITALIDQGCIVERTDHTIMMEEDERLLTVSPKGWTEIARTAQSGWQSTNAFIAMWFHESRRPFDEAIQRTVKNAGYDPIRIDRVQHVNRIDDEIIAQIRRARFLIADFTGQRNGVYFEAGFMLGLGRPVIWLCEKSELEQVHFDTRQYNTIDYTDAADLERRLQMRIEAILGKGPRSSD